MEAARLAVFVGLVLRHYASCFCFSNRYALFNITSRGQISIRSRASYPWTSYVHEMWGWRQWRQLSVQWRLHFQESGTALSGRRSVWWPLNANTSILAIVRYSSPRLRPGSPQAPDSSAKDLMAYSAMTTRRTLCDDIKFRQSGIPTK